eukprot:TRINITY_DN1015_c0_g1_i1.p2 TRINITY_DN1015_c0_g1~~TRINITY_DN1015_c0_g1_i1.p2  ORF type:complete len:147 (-),score=6.32 TRINITY_DN1015_c0_g1_i1:163-603(-)
MNIFREVIFFLMIVELAAIPLYLCDNPKLGCKQEDMDAGNEFSARTNVLGQTCQSLKLFCAKHKTQRQIPEELFRPAWKQDGCYQAFLKGCMDWSYRDKIDSELFNWCVKARYRRVSGCDMSTATEYIFTVTLNKCHNAAMAYCFK